MKENKLKTFFTNAVEKCKATLSDVYMKVKTGSVISSMRNKIEDNKIKKINKDYVSQTYDPALEVGLTSEEVAIRKKHGESNIFGHSNEKTYLEIVLSNIFTFYNILMFAVALLLIFFLGAKVIFDLSFILILVLNILIGTIQEIKSKNAIKKLKLLNTSKVTVIRDGKESEILPSEVCLEDLLKLKIGDQVPVDAIIKTDTVVDVNESILTGESRSVKKSTGDILYAGSAIISGSCIAIADKVGKSTYIYSLENKARNFKKPKSKLIVSIVNIIKLLAMIAIPLALLVFWNNLISPPAQEILDKSGVTSLQNAILYGGTTIAYMIPNGLVLVASIAMAAGVIKLANKKTLAQDLYSVEALSRIDTLCLDKTGTLTDGTMTVETVVPIDKEVDIDHLMSSYLKSFTTENSTSKALGKVYNFKSTLFPKKVVEFSSERKYSAVQFSDDRIYAMGAPEYLTKDAKILEDSAYYAENGLRTILLIEVCAHMPDEEFIKSFKNKEVALFVLRDNIRPEVKPTLEWFRENDVDIKIISGDNLKTVSYIAKKAGVDNWDKCVDMTTVSDDQIEYVALTKTIFARTTPDQKAKIVQALKANGRVVGMSGDGINDIASLKLADCSIALATGAPATKNVSNLVLLDDNFANMKDAVLEGRRVVNNIQRSASLFVMKDICWLCVSLLPIILGLQHQIEPSAMSLVNVIITGIGSFFLALEADPSRIRGNFIKTVLRKAIVAGFFMFLPVLMIYIVAICRYGIDVNLINAFVKEMIPVIALAITISGCIIFYTICEPFTEYRRMLFVITIVIIVFILCAVPELYLKNSTEFVNGLLEAGSIDNIVDKFLTETFFKFKVYKELCHIYVNGEDLKYIPYLILIIFTTISTILYKITDKVLTIFTEKVLFTKNPLIEDDQDENITENIK